MSSSPRATIAAKRQMITRTMTAHTNRLSAIQQAADPMAARFWDSSCFTRRISLRNCFCVCLCSLLSSLLGQTLGVGLGRSGGAMLMKQFVKKRMTATRTAANQTIGMKSRRLQKLKPNGKKEHQCGIACSSALPPPSKKKENQKEPQPACTLKIRVATCCKFAASSAHLY
jgi:hypothetical protein